jgi:hypothetical protein
VSAYVFEVAMGYFATVLLYEDVTLKSAGADFLTDFFLTRFCIPIFVCGLFPTSVFWLVFDGFDDLCP